MSASQRGVQDTFQDIRDKSRGRLHRSSLITKPRKDCLSRVSNGQPSPFTWLFIKTEESN